MCLFTLKHFNEKKQTKLFQYDTKLAEKRFEFEVCPTR